MKQMLAAAAALTLGACATTGVEEPAFNRVSSTGPFEIRDYAPVIVAETSVPGDAVASRYAGFNPLADYIFAKDRKGGKIAMTAPVTQAPRETIAMTAPVTQSTSSGGWTIAFTMPAGSTLEKLPAPVNPNVKLREEPARRMAVLRYSGTADDRIMKSREAELLADVAKSGLKPTGAPVHAFYDPPWTLPFFRRNEVMVEVEKR